jgi:hypothetical protein
VLDGNPDDNKNGSTIPMASVGLDKWIALASKMRDAGVELIGQSGKTISNVEAEDPRVIALALLARTLSHLKAITILTQQKMLIEALTLARSCYENSFRIARLDVDGESFVQEMRAESVANVKARGQTILENGCDIDPNYKADVQEVLRHIKKNHKDARILPPKNVVKETAIAEAYLAYLVLSRDSHPTLSSLSRHLEYDGAEDGSPIFVVEPEPSTEQLTETLIFACAATLTACVGTCQMVGLINSPLSLQEVSQAYADLIGDEPDTSGTPK